ncbi:MAG: LacI family DNA-binding transcriptional regulator [Chloroflexi bacterium]|nr:LacI family DNA-binding transcriptional regulator [Chloroflexota bacterium]
MEKHTLHRPVTQRDVAQRAGVSSSVVSYVINDGPRTVAGETRARVLQAIDELGYRPNKFAQGLKSDTRQAKREIGIIVGGDTAMFKRPFWAAVLAGIYEESYLQGRRIRFMHFFNDLRDPVLFNEHVHPEEISELILVRPSEMTLTAEGELLGRRIIERIPNIVCLGEPVFDLPAVVFDLHDAGCKAVQHLVALDHTRIAYVGTNDGRIEGYRQTLLRNNIQPDPRLMLLIHSLPPKGGYDAACALVAQAQAGRDFTAVFASSDETAIGVLAALHDAGLSVPEDVALVSVDDIPNASMIRPALTTVQVPKEQMGSYALRLLQNLRMYPDSTPVSVVLPTQLVVRDSCGSRRAEGG